MIPIVTTAPAAQARVTARPVITWPVPAKPRSRRVAVQVATPNMTASMTTTKPGAANTPRSARATTVSCTTARAPGDEDRAPLGHPPRGEHPHGDRRQHDQPDGQPDPGAHEGSGACGTSP